MNKRRWDFHRIRSRHLAYRYLMVVELIIIWMIPLWPAFPLISSLSGLLLMAYVLVFMSRFSNIKKGKRLLYLFGIATILAETLCIASRDNFLGLHHAGLEITRHPGFSVIHFCLWLIFFGLLIIRLVKALIREPFVTTSVIMGAGGGYLLLGLLGGVLLNTLYSLEPSAFTGMSAGTDPRAMLTIAAFGYLTSLGSDIVNEQSLLGQAGALTITLWGQLYVAILIALVLGRFHHRRIN